MTLMGACEWCRKDKPPGTPIERKRLYHGPDGQHLCHDHYAEAMEGVERDAA